MYLLFLFVCMYVSIKECWARSRWQQRWMPEWHRNTQHASRDATKDATIPHSCCPPTTTTRTTPTIVTPKIGFQLPLLLLAVVVVSSVVVVIAVASGRRSFPFNIVTGCLSHFNRHCRYSYVSFCSFANCAKVAYKCALK